MMGVVGNNNPAVTSGAETTSTPTTTAGASGPGGYLAGQKDSKRASTDPQFGAILNQVQAQYGAKEEKPREIKKTLGKDDFLRIMITQMKNQDPTSPFKAEQMATEMAQFTSVEQLQNVNQNLKAMATANQPLEHLAMTNLIGKTVTIDRERFPHQEGSPEALSMNLPKDAAEVKVTVVSDGGETVLEKDLGPQRAGSVDFNWDGKKSNTMPAKTGTYMLRFEAKDEKGRSLTTNPMSQARVIGVSFEGTEPVFLVGDAKSQTKVTLRNIIKIEEQGSPAGFPLPGGGAAPAGAAGEDKPAKFIAFKKGVGSSNANDGQMDPEAAKALAAYQESQAKEAAALANAPSPAPAQRAPARPYSDGERGFPNGLHDTPDTTEGAKPTAMKRGPASDAQKLVQN